jgi:PII-like signaling protein
MTPQSAKLLRIYMNEQDQYGGKPLYCQRARKNVEI